ncbi:hypothetical protein FEO90_06320 [Stenotrophomonas maltophilia]|nr:hypothetical protein FEO90_06320 [Stenotrophomonas maltophilia]
MALAVGAFTLPVAARNPKAASHASAAVPYAVYMPFERFTLGCMRLEPLAGPQDCLACSLLSRHASIRSAR